MISRIRIDGSGESAADVEAGLHDAADRVEAAFAPHAVKRGEQVIERDLEEPDGSFAFIGRLLLYLPMPSRVRITDSSGSASFEVSTSNTA
jgi:hypothetical protein